MKEKRVRGVREDFWKGSIGVFLHHAQLIVI